MEEDYWSDWSDETLTDVGLLLMNDHKCSTAENDNYNDVDSIEGALQQEINYQNMYFSVESATALHHGQNSENVPDAKSSSRINLNCQETVFATSVIVDMRFDSDNELDIPLSELKHRITAQKSHYQDTLIATPLIVERQHYSDEVDEPLAEADRVRSMNVNDNVRVDIYIEPEKNASDKEISTNTETKMSDSISISSQASYEEDKRSNRIKGTRKRKLKSRNKKWKRKGHHIKRGKIERPRQRNNTRIIEANTDSNENDCIANQTFCSIPSSNNIIEGNEMADADVTERAKLKSLKEKKIQDLLNKYHEKHLDKILASNLLVRKNMPADGNCMFSAILEYLKWPMTVHKLRDIVAQHLEKHSLEYKSFVSFPDALTEGEEREQFAHMISEIRSDGTWDTLMSDFVPLCVANVFQQPLRIFSSRPFQPIIDVKPNIVKALSEQPILVAHMAIQGQDHYDAVEKREPRTQNNTERGSLDLSADSSQSSPCKQHDTDVDITLTPHKDAAYKSPKKKKLSRKRVAKKHEWKSSLRKEARSKGERYVSKQGKHIKARSVKDIDCSHCRFKCTEKIDTLTRQKVFQTYWDLADYSLQRNFICSHVENKEPVRTKRKHIIQRAVANAYHFTIGHQKVRVCRNFFVRTLDVGRKTVDNAIKNKIHGMYTGADKRGSHAPSNKTLEADTEFVKQHIESFPTVEPHYCRKDTSRKYLSQDLNIRRMHTLYTEKCKEMARKPVGEQVYRNLFCQDYNMAFFRPKKDQCQFCNKFDHQKNTGTLNTETELQYMEHQERKEMARREKENDKHRAKKDPSFAVATFDLQAVLTTPCSLVGELYYKRKLCCYNLSFYELANGEAKCYLWDETQGGRGSCEVATCMMLHLNSLTNKASSMVEEVTYYCDTCGGQNRNQYVVSALHHCVKAFSNLKCINQKFLESGHSEMECDSVHATIEHAKKRTKIYVPSQWETVISLARHKKPYMVVPMKYIDFMDFKKYRQGCAGSMKMDITGEKVNWLKIKWIQVKKDKPDSVFVSYDFLPQNLREVTLNMKQTRGISKANKLKLTQRYMEKLPISSAKKTDLLSLCASGTIPQEYEAYYKSLPCSSKTKDRLPAPDANEEDEDTDDN